MKISGNTKIVGILGHPIGHTLSPVMQNAAFAALDLDYCYLPFDVPPEQLADAIRGLRALGTHGVNITIPHKETVFPLLDQLTEAAQKIGAVNTVEFTDNALIGHNTDGQGFLRALQEETEMNPKGTRVLILGGGGAARAVAVQLALAGAKEIQIMNRTLERGRALVDHLQQMFPSLQALSIPWVQEVAAWQSALEKIDLLVNTTPVGMEGKEGGSPLPTESIPSGLLVSDLVYHPFLTPLLQGARAKGARTLPGLWMLLHQGALSFEIWTGKRAPLSIMRHSLTETLASL